MTIAKNKLNNKYLGLVSTGTSSTCSTFNCYPCVPPTVNNFFFFYCWWLNDHCALTSSNRNGLEKCFRSYLNWSEKRGMLICRTNVVRRFTSLECYCKIGFRRRHLQWLILLYHPLKTRPPFHFFIRKIWQHHAGPKQTQSLTNVYNKAE